MGRQDPSPLCFGAQTFKQKGFTLLEVLLSVTIIGMLAGMSLPIYRAFISRNDLDIAAQDVAAMLRRGQTYARGVSDDSQWGVRVQTDSAILFKGSDFAARDTSYDEVESFPGPINGSGLSEVLFSKMTGAPSTSGNIVLTGANNETKTVTINVKGAVTF